jgi:hypothetical protein
MIVFKSVSGSWDPSTVDVNKFGVYSFEGTIAGCDKKVPMELTIKAVMKQVLMDRTLKDKLNTFFSNFSKVYVKDFEEGDISDEELIDFAINHITINNWGGKITWLKLEKMTLVTSISKVPT